MSYLGNIIYGIHNNDIVYSIATFQIADQFDENMVSLKNVFWWSCLDIGGHISTRTVVFAIKKIHDYKFWKRVIDWGPFWSDGVTDKDFVWMLLEKR